MKAKNHNIHGDKATLDRVQSEFTDYVGRTVERISDTHLLVHAVNKKKRKPKVDKTERDGVESSHGN